VASITKFWRMCEPEYESDYDCTFINGSLDHPYGLPGVACTTCGETWGGCRVLPIVCPTVLRALPELADASPIPAEQHRELRSRVRSQIVAELGRCPDLAPGDSLQPSLLEVPSTPEADFLWASFGSTVISDRVRPLFEQLGPDTASVTPLQSQRFGSGRPTLPAPIPESGEPDDLLSDIELVESPLPRYAELVVSAESGLPHGVQRRPPCPACGRAELDGSRELAVYDDMAPSRPLFCLATTLWIIVTDAFKRDLERLEPANVSFLSVG
jgi:Protein of unknown function (Gmx_para_CXXCG)